jgi:phage terminase Nu1 subunit (DNA packaging protein)
MTDITKILTTALHVLESQRQTAQNIAYQATSLMQVLAQHKADIEEAEKKRVQSSDEAVSNAEPGRLSTAK